MKRLDDVANEETRVEKVPDVARKSVPVAEVNERDVIVPDPIVPFVARKFAAKRCVDVVLVPVAFVHTRSVIVSGAVNVKFWMIASVAPKLVAKNADEVALVKTAAAGVERPIVTPLIVPPVSVAFPLERFVTVPLLVNENVVVPFVAFKKSTVPLVARRFVAKRCVEVVFVPVALVQVRLVGEKLLAEMFVKTPSVANTRLPVALLKLSVPTVDDPAAKLPVSVRLEPVALVNVAVWRPVVPVTVRFEIVAPP
jgi:hypothetical protein